MRDHPLAVCMRPQGGAELPRPRRDVRSEAGCCAEELEAATSGGGVSAGDPLISGVIGDGIGDGNGD